MMDYAVKNMRKDRAIVKMAGFVVLSLFFTSISGCFFFVYVNTFVFEALFLFLASLVNFGSVLVLYLRYSRKRFLACTIVFFSFSCVFVGSMLPYRSIPITAKNSPEIVFWTTINEIPPDTDVSVAICLHYANIKFENYAFVHKIEHLVHLNYSIYLAIGCISQFYLSLDTCDELLQVYAELKDFLGEVFYDRHIKGIVVDAETPYRYYEQLKNDPNGLFGYMLDNYPSKSDVAASEEFLRSFIYEVRADRKLAISCRMPTSLTDEVDLYTRNVYFNDIRWDLSVAQIYRTAYEEDYLSYLSHFFVNAERGANGVCHNDYWMLHRASLEESVIIGGFDEVFEDLSYIKEKKYLRDIDICRSLGMNSIWIFAYPEFIDRYGEAEYYHLLDHVSREQSFSIVKDGRYSYLLTIYYWVIKFFSVWDFR